MTRPKRFATTFAAMTATALLAVALLMNGVRGLTLVLSLVVLATVSYTIVDAVQADGRPRDAAWVRRAVTGNLVYVSVMAVLYLVVVALS